MRPTALLAFVTITGLCTLSLCHTRKYHIVYDRMNWTDAQQYCRDRDADLATIGSLEDVKTLNDTVDLHSLGQVLQSVPAFWIGLYDDINSWRWSLADEQKQKFRNWAPDEPDNLRGGENCAFMNSAGYWKDLVCTERNCAICVDDAEPKYIFINKSLTWDEAQTHCRERYTDLASVRNQTENEKIKQMISALSSLSRCWIGLYRDSWKWSDGSSNTFRDWDTVSGEPNGNKENCVALLGSGFKWQDWNCDFKSAFICHSNGPTTEIQTTAPTTPVTTPGPTTEIQTTAPTTPVTTPGPTTEIQTTAPTTPVTTPVPEVSVKKQVVRIKVTRGNSSLDLNNHAVKEAILEQVKQSLKDEGGTADIKLKWVEQSDGKVFHKEDKKKRKKKRERKPVLTKMEL